MQTASKTISRKNILGYKIFRVDIMTGIIYKAQNKINKKVYIGQTKRSLATRKAEHKYASQSDKTNSKFYNNINYYGFDNFK
jgi:hypothetical protein